MTDTATHYGLRIKLPCKCDLAIDVAIELLKEPEITFDHYVLRCPIHRIGTEK